MSVSDKIKAILTMKGKKSLDLAEYLNMSPQSMRNKFARGSFSSTDLIKIASYLNVNLAFIIDNDQKIVLDMNDIDKDE